MLPQANLGALDVARVELALFGRRKRVARHADERAAELLGAIAIVDRVELQEDGLVGAARALDGDLVLLAVFQAHEHLVRSRRTSLVCVEQAEAQLAPHAVRTRDLGERYVPRASVDDVEVRALAELRRDRGEDRAHRLGGAAFLADHLADVFLRDAELDHAVVLGRDLRTTT